MCVCVCGGVCTRGWWEGVGLYVCMCVWRGVYSWVVGGGRSVCVCMCVEGSVLVGGARG